MPNTGHPSIRTRLAQPTDAESITQIYNHAIEHTTASFWTEPQRTESIAEQIRGSTESYPWVVAEIEPHCAQPNEHAHSQPDSPADNAGVSRSPTDAVVGVAWSKAWNPRQAYAGTAEVSIYVAPSMTGRGIGRVLYQDLLDRLDRIGYTSVLAGITLPNLPSVRLHEAVGFKHVGTFDRIGEKFGQKLDVGYWQRRAMS